MSQDNLGNEISTVIVLDMPNGGYNESNTWTASYHFGDRGDRVVLLDDFPMQDHHLLMSIRARLNRALEFFHDKDIS